jgi:hypothetical protein
MLTRRALFEHCAAAAMGSAVLGATPAAAEHARQRATKIGAFVMEADSPDADTVAEVMAAQGVPSVAYEDDLAGIYSETLLPAWRGDDPVAIAGLTGAVPLFYLERLAWSDGLRTLFLGRHASGSDGWSHTLAAPQMAIDTFRIGVRLSDWHDALARALLRAPAVAQSQPLTSVRDAVLAGDRALFSWVLARPAARG